MGISRSTAPPLLSSCSCIDFISPLRVILSLFPSSVPQLGFSLVEAGTVRFKNTRNIMIKNVLDTCISAIAFWLMGYAIGFGSGSAVFGWQEADSVSPRRAAIWSLQLFVVVAIQSLELFGKCSCSVIAAIWSL